VQRSASSQIKKRVTFSMMSQALSRWKIRNQNTIRRSWLPTGNSAISSSATLIIYAGQSTRRTFNEKYKSPAKENLSLSLYPKKPSTIASGATTFGSAGHAPDDIIKQNKQLREGCKGKTKSLLEPILETIFDYSLRGYYHRERCSRTQRNFSFQEW
jgi:hypothetical protein